MSAATIQLGLDASPFEQGLNQAASKATSFEGKLTNLFRRGPRAERVLSSGLENLASGNVEGAIVGIASSLTGLGVAAGIGIAAAVVGFIKLKGQANETEKALDELNKSLARPHALVIQEGPAAIGEQIDTLTQKLDAFDKKRESIGSKLANLGKDVALSFTAGPALGTAESIDNKKSADSRKEITSLSRAQADAEVAIATAKSKGVNESEQAGKFAEIELEHRKQLAEIVEKSGNKPGRDQETLFRRITAATIENQAATVAIDNKNQESLRQERAITTEVALQATGQTRLAKLYEIRSNFATKIKKAEREGVPVADEFRKQETLTRQGFLAGELGKSGPQKFQEFLAESEKGRLLRTQQALEKDAADRRKRGSRPDAQTKAEEESTTADPGTTDDPIASDVSDILAFLQNNLAAA